MGALDEFDTLIIGGGVVGMAVARALARAGREVVLLEAESTFGAHTSSRNSEVIHAGIYYPRGSLKATLCVAGKHALYDYCAERGIPHQRIGKVIVACNETQRQELEQIKQRAHANGVEDLEWLDIQQLRELEPAVVAAAGLFSPSTGIIDSHELLQSFRQEAEAAGAIIVPSSPVLGGKVTDRGISISVAGAEPTEVHCRAVINAAGLFAPRVAESIEGVPRESIPSAYFAKGHYYMLAGRSPFRHLVYPVPEPGGLGIHVTLDMAGATRFGPDVAWIDGVDYNFDATSAHKFYPAIRSYFPALEAGALLEGYTGIRPKISGPGQAAADFVVQGPDVHGLPLVNLYGIESPGLTASLALADLVRRTLA